MAHDLSGQVERSAQQVRTHAESLGQTVRRQHPLAAAIGGQSFRAADRFGARVSGSRIGRFSVAALAGMLFMVAPVAAQSVSCSDGPLSFLAALYSMVTMSAGTIIVSMVILAGVLKMIPMRGTNSWGNALVSSVIVGVLFLVVGPALIDLANPATPIQLNAQCT
jgi:hypothetical protein